MENKKELLEHLEHNTKVLQDPLVKEAFSKIDRGDFVSEDYLYEAYQDYPLPIGQGQTISQPTTVAFMLEKLEITPGQKILDVGSGSGFTTALLAQMTGEAGEVYAVEKLPELVELGRNNLKKYTFDNAEIFESGEMVGLPEHAPYDRILVSAASRQLPEALVDQLEAGGIIVIPIGESICKIIKKDDEKLEKKEYPGFLFVPLI